MPIQKTFARDGTWLHDWDPVHAMEAPWLTPPKKFRTQPSAGKKMTTGFLGLQRDYIGNLESVVTGLYVL